ncbi:Pre-mRNA-splicing factor [Erysiphe necator]|uniref:Putative coiled-coil domain-containing n=1 Tax=Uncinula necator TaxID=52586 RepID=A0A0B1P534_UNCNE|nr:Pre-mRNA-splicing factor [Erysiphe necator]KHJ32455.1 putative coiled-coil domain-containing [Erysiphe necator]
MSSTHITLGAAADERKARLAKLKSLKRKVSDDEQLESEPILPNSAEKIDVAKKHLSGRNYDAESKGPKLGFENRPDLTAKTTLEQQALEIEHEIRKHNQEEQEDKGVDLFKLQPKRPNWDLKRNLNTLLETLNVRTENAIARLVHERIESTKSSSRSTINKNAISPSESEEIGINGIDLVEGLKLREKENLNESMTPDGEEGV